jgi:Spy/CpxP family protein refolding chaperone
VRTLYRKTKILGRMVGLAAIMLVLGSICFGQQPAPGFSGPPPGGPVWPGPPAPGVNGLMVGPPGRWWDDPALSRKLGLTPKQQKKMDEIFNTSRLKLIDLFASVQREEAILEPLVDADPPDENKILAQIDRLAEARAGLEKTIGRMLIDLRLQLTHDQWVKLKAERPPLHDMQGGPGGPNLGLPGGNPGKP